MKRRYILELRKQPMEHKSTQFYLDKFSFGNKCQTSQLFPDLHRPDIEQTISFIRLSSRGVESKEREWEGRNKRSKARFSLNCQREGLVCNKALLGTD